MAAEMKKQLDCLKKSRASYTGAITRTRNKFQRMAEEPPSSYDMGLLQATLASTERSAAACRNIQQKVNDFDTDLVDAEVELDITEQFEEGVNQTVSLLNRLMATRRVHRAVSDLQSDLLDLGCFSTYERCINLQRTIEEKLEKALEAVEKIIPKRIRLGSSREDLSVRASVSSTSTPDAEVSFYYNNKLHNYNVIHINLQITSLSSTTSSAFLSAAASASSSGISGGLLSGGSLLSGTYGGPLSDSSGGLLPRISGGLLSTTSGGLLSGTSGGSLSGTCGGSLSGTSGVLLSGTSGSSLSGTSGGSLSGTSGILLSGTSGGLLSGTSGGL